QRELQLPRSSGADWADIHRRNDGAKASRSRPRRDIRYRVCVLRVIKDVEHLGPELKLHAFGQRDALAQTEIHLPRSRPAPYIPGSVSKRTGSGSDKCGWIEPQSQRRSARWGQGNSRHDIGTLIVGIAVRYISRRTVNGDIDGKARARFDN